MGDKDCAFVVFLCSEGKVVVFVMDIRIRNALLVVFVVKVRIRNVVSDGVGNEVGNKPVMYKRVGKEMLMG